jgi:hypothetical protein
VPDTLKVGACRADLLDMGRSAIGLLAFLGMSVGGFVPELWGAGSFSLQSLLFSALGGIAGVWFGVRLADF